MRLAMANMAQHIKIKLVTTVKAPSRSHALLSIKATFEFINSNKKGRVKLEIKMRKIDILIEIFILRTINVDSSLLRADALSLDIKGRTELNGACEI